MKWSGRTLLLSAALLVPAVGVACGPSKGTLTGSSTSGATTAESSTSSAGAGGGVGGSIGIGGGSVGHGMITAIAITPPQATLQVVSGSTAGQIFQAVATYQDKTMAPVTSAQWSATNPAVGSIDGTGVFTANGNQGGYVTVTATVDSLMASADLAVVLSMVSNPDGVDMPTQTALKLASTPDPSVVWAYPYDGMVYPRGITGPSLMWNGGSATDAILVHLKSGTMDLQVFRKNVSGELDLDPATWSTFVESTSGPAELTVSRFASGMATVLVDQHDTVAPGEMRGTIYYWAINTGRVMRITPGAMADDFLGPSVTCPSCHTVSANGAHLVMNEGSWPDETSIAYNLGTSADDFSGLYTTAGASQWALAGVSADGSVIVQNFASLRGPIGQATGAFDAVTGTQIPSTGLEGNQLFMPAFAPDDQLLAYVDSSSGDLRAYDWDPAMKVATNDRLIVPAGSDPTTNVINAPTVSPDHQWIIYQRSNQNGSLGNAADLYMASVAQPGTEVALANLDGATYPFAAGDRDRHLNFEPTFAPVAAGGYFWVVFHSRRTYGNLLTGAAFGGEGSGVKQLWVAAIDQAPMMGQDPSHPAFWLPGQDPTTLNMRGYWALPPCEADGQSCMTGTDCCGGYCDASGDSGPPVCKSSSSGCSPSGDHCATAADCCNTKASCINSVCSDPPPN